MRGAERCIISVFEVVIREYCAVKQQCKWVGLRRLLTCDVGFVRGDGDVSEGMAKGEASAASAAHASGCDRRKRHGMGVDARAMDKNRRRRLQSAPAGERSS